MANSNTITKIYSLKTEGYFEVHNNFQQLSKDLQAIKATVIQLKKEMVDLAAASAKGADTAEYKQLAAQLNQVREQELKLKVAISAGNVERLKQSQSTGQAVSAFQKLVAELRSAQTALEDIAAEHGVESEQAKKAAANVAVLRDRYNEIKNLAKTKTQPVINGDQPAATSGAATPSAPATNYNQLNVAYKQAITNARELAAQYGIESKEATEAAKSAMQLKQQLDAINQTATGQKLKQDEKAAADLSNEYLQLSRALKDAELRYKNLALVTPNAANNPVVKEALQQALSIRDVLDKLDVNLRNYQRNVGNYASGFNGLNMAVQQILRETPSAVNSLNTFFLAISNNLPILFDELQKAGKEISKIRDEYDAANVELAKQQEIQKLAAAASDVATASLDEQVETIITSVGANEAQALAIREQVAGYQAEVVSSGAASAATIEKTTATLANAGATAEQIAIIEEQIIATGQAAAASRNATIALEAQTAATIQAAAASAATPSVFARIMKSLFSLQSLLTIGVLLLTAFGSKLFAAVPALFQTKKAADDAGKSIEDMAGAQEDLNKAIEGTDYKSAIANIEKMKAVVASAKDGFTSKKDVVEQYNKTLGNALGTAKNFNEVEDKMADKTRLDAYLKAMLYKAAAYVALGKAAEAAQKAEEERQKKVEDFSNGAVDSRISSGGAIGFGTGAFNPAEYEKESQRIKDAQAKRQQDAIKIQTDAQQKQADIAKSFFEKVGQISKDFKLDVSPFDDKTKQKSQQQYNSYAEDVIKNTKALQDAVMQQNLNFFKRLADDEKNSYDVRLNATAAYYQALQNKIDQDEAFQIQQELASRNKSLSQQKLTDEQRKNIIEASELNILKIRQDAVNQDIAIDNEKWDKLQQLAIQKSNEILKTAASFSAQENARAKASLHKFESESKQTGLEKTAALYEASYNKQLADLNTSYANKLISQKEYVQKAQELNKTLLQQQLATYEAEAALLDAGSDKWVEITNKISALKTALATLNNGPLPPTDGSGNTPQNPFSTWQSSFEYLQPMVDSATNTLNGFFDAQAQRIEENKQKQLDNLEAEKQIRLAKAQSAAESAAIQEQYDNKQAAIEQKALNRWKKQKRSELTISLFSELAAIALNAARNPTNAVTFGAAGVIQYAVLAALALGRYAIGMSNINKSTFAYGGNPDMTTTRGGKVGGRSHADGGNPFIFKGRVFEDEVDELNIIRTKNAPRNQVFQAIGTQQQIASALNKVGGGIDFAPGASIKKHAYGGTLGAVLQAPIFTPASNNVIVNMNELIDEVRNLRAETAQLRDATVDNYQATNNRFENLKAHVVVQEITNAQKKKAKQTRIATL